MALIFNSNDLITENNKLHIFANLALDLAPVGMNVCLGDSLQDYALIRLDRKSNRTPLKVRTRGQVTISDQLFLVGHPLGLPLIYSPSASVNENTNLVEGMLVGGEKDLETNENGHFQKYITYTPTNKSDKLKGESITRIKFILPFMLK